MTQMLWAHGLEGSPNGTKVRALRAAGFDVRAPDFGGMDLAERVALLERELLQAADKVLLAGSSYGGVAAAVVARRQPQSLRALLLCAPALALKEPPIESPDEHHAPPGLPTVLVHGTEDAICGLDGSQDYIARSGAEAELVVVKDGHRLEASLDVITAAARRLLRS